MLRSTKKYSLILLCILTNCFAGGIHQKGGFSYHAGFQESATPIGTLPWKVICYDNDEAKRRAKLPLEETRNLGPPVLMQDPATYNGTCKRTGESSVFFLFNMWPVTNPLNPEYAISTAVQELEGDTMINIRFWHEKHYYSVLGSVVVFKAKGDVIRFQEAEPPKKQNPKQRRR